MAGEPVADGARRRTEARTPGGVVEVEKEKATTVVKADRGRISLTLTNDSAATIYVFKGPGAKINEGIRLNKEGGAIVIDDYTGEVTAAATEKGKLGFSEV